MSVWDTTSTMSMDEKTVSLEIQSVLNKGRFRIREIEKFGNYFEERPIRKQGRKHGNPVGQKPLTSLEIFRTDRHGKV